MSEILSSLLLTQAVSNIFAVSIGLENFESKLNCAFDSCGMRDPGEYVSE